MPAESVGAGLCAGLGRWASVPALIHEREGGLLRARHIGAVIVAAVLVSSPGQAECPPAEAVEAQLKQLDLRAAYRTEEFDLQPPWDLYARAAEKSGKAFVDRSGKLGQAVVVADIPVEALWMAINDEDHYAEGDYLPVEYSEVIEGTPRGERRILFQYFKRSGVGRWWIDELEMNGELFAQSDGRLWELRWWDLMEDRAADGLPAEFSDLGLSPIKGSRGSWLMIPLSESCTLIEYVTVSNPGGFLNIANWFAAGHVIRENLEGLQRLAKEHVTEPHPESTFLRPDGTVIQSSATTDLRR